MKRSIRWLWRIFLFLVIGFNILIAGFWFNWWGGMPSIEELENPSSSLSSEVLASDGTVMGKYFVQDRSNSKYSEISPNVFNALIATEDVRFYEHSGIDGRAVLRALTSFGSDGGASTITQQLAFNLFNGNRAHNKFVRIGQKLKEWVLAVKLEKNLTKNEIITLYLNTVPFPDNVYGIKNASMTFFSKTPDKLSTEEAAVLIGSLKGNSIYNPRTHAAKSLLRRNTVIEQMEKYGKITATQALAAKAKPLKLDYHKIDYHEGVAPYFRQVLEKQVKTALKDTKNPLTGQPYDIYKDGLRIYTTIDMRMQNYAELAVEDHMRSLQKLFMQQGGYANRKIWHKHQDIIQRCIKSSERYQNMKDDEDMKEADIMNAFRQPVKMRVFAWNAKHYVDTVMTPIDSIMYTRMFLQAAFMAMDPLTGEVKAWVGGIDHDYFQFDHVNENTKRQVGSTIKPLLYCLAVDNGFSPCGTVSCAPQSFPGKPFYNAGGAKYGAVPMKKALALSINNAALYLLKQTGIPAFVDFAKRCGIRSDMQPYPSIALGASDISLIEMVGAYTMFPAGGLNTQPYFITKIEDKNGILVKAFAPQQKEIINSQVAFRMVNLMRGVVNFGTGARMRRMYGIKADIAGKTGTTNNQADGWFIGYSPQILAGAWVGCDDRFLRFQSEALGQGAAAALPIWALFYKKIAADRNLGIDANMKFKEPENFDDCDVTDQNSLDRAGYNYGSRSTGSGADEDEKDVNSDAPPPDESYDNSSDAVNPNTPQ